MTPARIPLWFKIGYTVWVIVWAILYARVEPSLWHFMWMCHLGNFLIAAGLWLENPLILSWQALSLLMGDILWTLDFVGAIFTRRHLIGATGYMFNDTFPPMKKALALFHLGVPILLIWVLRRFGYDRRALWLQIAACWVVFPISYLVTDPLDNINWVLGPFGQVQTVVPGPVFLLAAMVLYVLCFFLPSHLLLMALFRRPTRSV